MGAGIHSASDVEGRASSTMHLLRVLLLAHGSRSEGAGPPRARRCKGANDVPRFREEGSSCRFQYDTWHTGGYATGSLRYQLLNGHPTDAPTVMPTRTLAIGRTAYAY